MNGVVCNFHLFTLSLEAPGGSLVPRASVLSNGEGLLKGLPGRTEASEALLTVGSPRDFGEWGGDPPWCSCREIIDHYGFSDPP